MHQPTPFDEDATPLETIVWTLVAVTMLVIPFVIMRPAVDVFRTPKDVVFETLALVILATSVAGSLLGARLGAAFSGHRTPLLLAASAMLWTAVVVTTSLQREVSFFKPIFVFCLAVFFCAALWTTRRRGLTAIALAIVPAALNAIIAFLQSTPAATFVITKDIISRRMWVSGLIGNPNELGGYFVLPLMASIAAAIAWPRLRWAFGATALILAGGVVAAQSVTPVIATAAGVAAMTLLPGARAIRYAGIITLVLLVTALSLHPGARTRMTTLVKNAQSGELLEMTSYRLPAFAVALRMFRDRPLLGVGPGVFAARYMPYKLRIDADHPDWIRVGNQNFGEVHNDHLQLLAETGVPGYLIFLAALVILSRLSFLRRGEMAPRARFVRSFAFPAAAAFAALGLAHFPMQLTSTMMPAVFLAALCFAWTDADEVA